MKKSDVVSRRDTENELVITLQSTASPDVTFMRYSISNGTNYTKPNMTHTFKNLDGKVKPMVVQVVNIRGQNYFLTGHVNLIRQGLN